MPIYSWQCKNCSDIKEIVRKMDDYNKGPDDACEKCQGTNYQQIITEPPRFILEGQGWHRDSYTRYRSIK